MGLIGRLIPFLAAAVALIALAGVVVIELNAQQRAEAVSQELARIRLTIDLLTQRRDTEAVAAGNGFADGLLALQARMVALEERLEAGAVNPQETALSPETATTVERTAEALDPNLPTEDCIPLGTRFMAVTGDSYPICQSPVVVRVTGITADNVVVEGAGVITETGFANIAGTNCTLLVFSADIEGFAEMRVTCT